MKLDNASPSQPDSNSSIQSARLALHIHVFLSLRMASSMASLKESVLCLSKIG